MLVKNPKRRYLWYDLETSGLSAAHDQVLQYAWMMTDADLNLIKGSETKGIVQIRPDVIPSPKAFSVHRLSAQKLAHDGVSEREFIKRFLATLEYHGGSNPVNICGYNNISFDDEFIRHTLYRNLCAPYDHEWRGQNRRFDALSLARYAYMGDCNGPMLDFQPKADNPERPDLTLVGMAAANKILPEGAAHDALVDVRMTLQLARKFQERHPEAFAFASEELTDKRHALKMIGQSNHRNAPLWIASRLAPKLATMILPICPDVTNKNRYYALDVNASLDDLTAASPEDIRKYCFLPAAQRTANDPEIPILSLDVNKMLIIDDAQTDDPAAHDTRCARFHIDRHMVADNLNRIESIRENLAERIREAFSVSDLKPDTDQVYGGLYQGGFISESDRRKLDGLRMGEPEAIRDTDLAACWRTSRDKRMGGLSLRYKWSNYGRDILFGQSPLHEMEQKRYAQHLLDRHFSADQKDTESDSPEKQISRWEKFTREMNQTRIDHAHDSKLLKVLDDLNTYASEHMQKTVRYAQGVGATMPPEYGEQKAGKSSPPPP